MSRRRAIGAERVLSSGRSGSGDKGSRSRNSTIDPGCRGPYPRPNLSYPGAAGRAGHRCSFSDHMGCRSRISTWCPIRAILLPMAPRLSAGVERRRRDSRAVLGPGGRAPSSNGPCPPPHGDYPRGITPRETICGIGIDEQGIIAPRPPRDDAVSPRTLRRSPLLGAVPAQTRFVRFTGTGRDGGHDACADLDEVIRRLGRSIGMGPRCGQRRSSVRGAGSLERKSCNPPIQLRACRDRPATPVFRSARSVRPRRRRAGGQIGSTRPGRAFLGDSIAGPTPSVASLVRHATIPHHPQQGNPSSPP